MKSKHLLIRTRALSILFACAALISKAQNPEKTDALNMRKAGFGMKFSLLGGEDLGLTSSLEGGKTFFVSINPVKNFRIEPEFGFSHNTRPAELSSGSLVSKGSRVGGSMFYMYQKGNTNFYGGPSVSLGKINYQEEITTYSSMGVPSYKIVDAESKDLAIGGILGAEYFFNSHFSLGSELGLFSHKYTTTAPASSSSTSTTRESTALGTTGSLVLRAYF